jgi:hypothetical protein
VRPRLVDAHTHLLPDRLAKAIRGYFVQFITSDFFPYPPEADACRAALVAAGVDRCWTLPYVRRAGTASGLNRWMAERWAEDPVVEPGATVHPEDEVGALADEALGLGLRLFKVHCAVGEFSLGDPRLDPLWERVSARQVPVVVHLGHSPTGHTEAEELPALEAVARAWPRAPIILAHLGAPAVQEGLAILRRCPSLYADLTPVVVQGTPVTASDLEGLEERILFGTDVPSVALRIEEVVAHLRSLGLSPRAERAIFAGNADRLVPPR